MKSSVRVLRKLALLSQMLFSVAVPLLLFIGGGQWLTERHALGRWVMLIAVLLGVLGAIGGFVRTIKAFLREEAPAENRPVSFNDHQ